MALANKSFFLPPSLSNASKLAALLKGEGATVRESLPEDNDTVCILDSFEQSELFTELLTKGAPIISSHCLAEVIEKKSPLPDLTFPLWARYLDGFSVCIDETCLSKDKLQSLLHYMGAREISSPMNQSASGMSSSKQVLLAERVGSMLYRLANQAQVKVLHPSWLIECWNQQKLVRPAKPFILPPFAGLMIGVTGLTPSTRGEIDRLARAYGGEYTPNLTKKCTHLLSNSPTGIKYRYALEWGIHCVTTQWFFDSINANIAMDETMYFVPMSEKRRKALFHPLSTSSRDLSRLSPALREKHMLQISRSRSRFPPFSSAGRSKIDPPFHYAHGSSGRMSRRKRALSLSSARDPFSPFPQISSPLSTSSRPLKSILRSSASLPLAENNIDMLEASTFPTHPSQFSPALVSSLEHLKDRCDAVISFFETHASSLTPVQMQTLQQQFNDLLPSSQDSSGI